MKRLSVILALACGAAYADTTTTTATTTTPTDVCNQLVKAAESENYETVATLSTMPTKGERSKGKFKKMHDDYLAKIKGITCGTSHVASDRAFVEAETQGQKRFIPFVNTAGQWKFDMKTYKAFYAETGHGHHGKKGAKKSM